MYVYIWKSPDGTPFYVGVGSSIGRSNPKAKCHRNKRCLEKLAEIGADAVVVEVRTAPNEEAAKLLEQQLIRQYKRLRDGGTLTNISSGGEFHKISPKTKQKLRLLWSDAEHREKILRGKVGKKRTLPESTKKSLRESLANNPGMKGWGERNGKDAEFDAKRIAGIRAAQGKRREKMSNPEALAQRKARLSATLNSPEYKAKRALWDTPKHREKIAAAKREYWAKKRAASTILPQQ